MTDEQMLVNIYYEAWVASDKAVKALAEAEANEEFTRNVMQQRWRECRHVPPGAYRVNDGMVVVVGRARDYPVPEVLR